MPGATGSDRQLHVQSVEPTPGRRGRGTSSWTWRSTTPAAAKIHQQLTTGQSFQAGQQRTFQWTWAVPPSLAPGVYTVKLGIFSGNWGTLYTWHNAAASVTVP